MTTYPSFLLEAGRILNSGQTRVLLLTGAVHDLFPFPHPEGTRWVPLVELLTQTWDLAGRLVLVQELNGPIRSSETAEKRLQEAWVRWRTGLHPDQVILRRMLEGKLKDGEKSLAEDEFRRRLRQAVGQPTVALEFLRQLCLCSRSKDGGRGVLEADLIILVEAAEMAIPSGAIPRLGDADRRRIAICQDWFSDPGFLAARDSVLLIAESASTVSERIVRLPQVTELKIPAPDLPTRKLFLESYSGESATPGPKALSEDTIASQCAGLSLQDMRQIFQRSAHRREPLTQDVIRSQVALLLEKRLGADVVEVKHPGHRLEDVVGFTRLKDFFREELIPRFRQGGDGSLPGAAVAGPIGAGKTFIFEALAAELDAPVLVLKNLRSQWYGQTDVLFDRLRRVLESLSRVVIFIDEADTQLGSLSSQSHATERRLLGRIQAMMSDPSLRGQVFWLLMTARIDRLSPDLRRPGRVGDLIIPVLDPEGEDRRAFLRWVLSPLFESPPAAVVDRLDQETEGYSAASFAALRSLLKSRLGTNRMVDPNTLFTLVHDLLPPPIERTRRIQTLQALVNCTRRSLLPQPEISHEERLAWREELERLLGQSQPY